jgi:hypothetical protein
MFSSFQRVSQFLEKCPYFRPAFRFAQLCLTGFQRVRKLATGHPRFSLAARLLLAFTAAYLFDQWLDYRVQDNVLTKPIFSIALIYHKLITASPRKPMPRFTALVKLSPDTVPLGVNAENVCRERAFIGELLKSFVAAHPKVVLIDKYFGQNTCIGNPDDGTPQLFKGVAALCENDVTVVVGRAVDAVQLRNPVALSSYNLQPALEFNKAKGCGCVKEGVSNRDPDVRRAHFWWPNIRPVSESLALVATRAAAPDLFNNSRLAGWSPESPPPYVSFVKDGQFNSATLAANDFICDPNGSPVRPLQETPNWRGCEKNELRQETLVRLRSVLGKVVVIGEDWPDPIDRHPSDSGDSPGYVLAANYIESVLDDRVFRPLPDALGFVSYDSVAGFVIFMSVELLFWRFRGVQALLCLGGVLLLVVLLIYLSVNLAGFYPDPNISIFAIFGCTGPHPRRGGSTS